MPSGVDPRSDGPWAGLRGPSTALLACAACGRVAFAELDAGPPDGTGDGPGVPDACALGPFGAPQRVANVNAVGVDDWSPSVSADGLDLYFYSLRASQPGAPDIWRATRPTAVSAFGAAQVIGEVSSPNLDWSPRVTDDQLVMLFTSLRGGTGQLDIYESQRDDVSQAWGPPVERVELNDATNDSHVWISGDGLRVVFASSRGTGQDLFAASRSSRAQPFGAAQPIAEINTAATEMSPALSHDELELLFVSDRAGGLGQLDLWGAARPTSGAPFGRAENLASLNSARDDTAPSLSSDGRSLYYNYDALVGGGADADIHVATRGCQ